MADVRYNRKNDTRIPKPPKGPEKPLMPYMRYSRKVWENVKNSNPLLKLWEVGKIIGQMWRELPDNQKIEYQEEYDTEKVLYADSLRQYHNSPAYQQWRALKERIEKDPEDGNEADKKTTPNKRPLSAEKSFTTTNVNTDFTDPRDAFILEDVEADEDEFISTRHVALLRYERNHQLMWAIFGDPFLPRSQQKIPDPRQLVSSARLRDLREQVMQLEGHLKQLNSQIETDEIKHSNKIRKISEESFAYKNNYQQSVDDHPHITADDFIVMVRQAQVDIEIEEKERILAIEREEARLRELAQKQDEKARQAKEAAEAATKWENEQRRLRELAEEKEREQQRLAEEKKSWELNEQRRVAAAAAAAAAAEQEEQLRLRRQEAADAAAERHRQQQQLAMVQQQQQQASLLSANLQSLSETDNNPQQNASLPSMSQQHSLPSQIGTHPISIWSSSTSANPHAFARGVHPYFAQSNIPPGMFQSQNHLQQYSQRFALQQQLQQQQQQHSTDSAASQLSMPPPLNVPPVPIQNTCLASTSEPCGNDQQHAGSTQNSSTLVSGSTKKRPSKKKKNAVSNTQTSNSGISLQSPISTQAMNAPQSSISAQVSLSNPSTSATSQSLTLQQQSLMSPLHHGLGSASGAPALMQQQQQQLSSNVLTSHAMSVSAHQSGQHFPSQMHPNSGIPPSAYASPMHIYPPNASSLQPYHWQQMYSGPGAFAGLPQPGQIASNPPPSAYMPQSPRGYYFPQHYPGLPAMMSLAACPPGMQYPAGTGYPPGYGPPLAHLMSPHATAAAANTSLSQQQQQLQAAISASSTMSQPNLYTSTMEQQTGSLETPLMSAHQHGSQPSRPLSGSTSSGGLITSTPPDTALAQTTNMAQQQANSITSNPYSQTAMASATVANQSASMLQQQQLLHHQLFMQQQQQHLHQQQMMVAAQQHYAAAAAASQQQQHSSHHHLAGGMIPVSSVASLQQSLAQQPLPHQQQAISQSMNTPGSAGNFISAASNMPPHQAIISQVQTAVPHPGSVYMPFSPHATSGHPVNAYGTPMMAGASSVSSTLPHYASNMYGQIPPPLHSGSHSSSLHHANMYYGNAAAHQSLSNSSPAFYLPNQSLQQHGGNMISHMAAAAAAASYNPNISESASSLSQFSSSSSHHNQQQQPIVISPEQHSASINDSGNISTN